MRERISADFDFLFSITPPFEAAIGFGRRTLLVTKRLRLASVECQGLYARPSARASHVSLRAAFSLFRLSRSLSLSSPGRGQARLARAGEGSSHIYLALNTLHENWHRSETSLSQSDGSCC